MPLCKRFGWSTNQPNDYSPNLSVYLSCKSASVSASLLVYLSTTQSSFPDIMFNHLLRQTACLAVYLTVCQLVCLSLGLSQLVPVCLSVCLPICLSM